MLATEQEIKLSFLHAKADGDTGEDQTCSLGKLFRARSHLSYGAFVDLLVGFFVRILIFKNSYLSYDQY